jgi:murein DD-endopeptidase MepM/ murein hydrolase activator NlpD
MRAARRLLAPTVLALGVALAVPAGIGAAPASAAPASAVGVRAVAPAAVVAGRASRTYKRTPTGGRYCPVIGASLGDGFGVPRSGHRHQGIDLMIGKGRRIFAVESGRILRASRISNGALRIVMQGRSGAKYFYGHNSKDLVKAGQRVRAGQVIALTGDTGAPGTPHLHFEYWPSGRESAAVNPLALVRKLCF